MKNFLTRFISATHIIGIECFLKEDGSQEFNLISIKRSKNDFDIQQQESEILSIDELMKFLNTKVPVVLVVDGKGVIHKKISDIGLSQNDNFLNKILPNANPVDFHIQKTPLSENRSFISIIRKSILDPIISVLESNKIQVISCSLGPFPISSIIPIISQEHVMPGNTISVSRYSLEIPNNNIEDFQMRDSVLEQTFKVGEENVKSDFIMAFSKALESLLMPFKLNPGISSEAIQKSRSEFKGSKIFKISSIAVLCVFMFILMFNFFLYNYYSQKVSAVSELLNISNTNTHKYDSLKNEVSLRKQFISKSGLLQNSRTSFYADRLAATLPEQIRLTELNINPVIKSSTDEDSLAFNINTISISGLCDKSLILNKWIKSLKKLGWIKEVSILNFKQDKLLDMGQFQIQLNINPFDK